MMIKFLKVNKLKTPSYLHCIWYLIGRVKEISEWKEVKKFSVNVLKRKASS